MKTPAVHEVSKHDLQNLEQIGRLRFEVWRAETRVDESQFPNGVWLEPLDYQARHWLAFDGDDLIGSARLSMHATLEDNPDGYLWLRHERTLPLPSAHFCKLVVSSKARGMGLGREFNRVRIEAAREEGAKSILVTASDANARLLLSMGFTETGVIESFSNRPGFMFRALQLVF